MKITRFDKETAKLIQDRLAVAFRPIAEELGLKVQFRATYRDRDATYRLLLTPKETEKGEAYDKDREAYKLVAANPNQRLKLEWLDQAFHVLGAGEFRIVGFNPKARKSPVIIQDVKTGKKFVASQTLVVESMNDHQETA